MNNEEEFSELMSNVMNLPCRLSDSDFASATDRLNYKTGHRDARHDAVDLIAEFASRCRAQGGNTSDNITQAAANKAAEEGEQFVAIGARIFDFKPHKQQPEHKAKYVQFALEAIAADRASRQVANKAEVDLSEVELADPEYVRAYIAGLQEIIEDLSKRTPPATTGASTVPHWYDSPQTALGGKTAREGYAANPAYAHLQPVGASTVLTDERTAALTEARDAVAEMRNHLETFGQYGEETARAALDGAVDTIDELIGEVAAQAGQVAVPEGWKLVPIDPKFGTMLHMAWLSLGNGPQPRCEEMCAIYTAMLAAAPSPAKESK